MIETPTVRVRTRDQWIFRVTIGLLLSGLGILVIAGFSALVASDRTAAKAATPTPATTDASVLAEIERALTIKRELQFSVKMTADTYQETTDEVLLLSKQARHKLEQAGIAIELVDLIDGMRRIGQQRSWDARRIAYAAALEGYVKLRLASTTHSGAVEYVSKFP